MIHIQRGPLGSILGPFGVVFAIKSKKCDIMSVLGRVLFGPVLASLWGPYKVSLQGSNLGAQIARNSIFN